MTPRPSMSAQSTPAELLQTALAADGARPFVTFYDDASGERVELSVATFENWVAKTANLLQDGLAAEPGERVAILLPAHWQAQVWLLACWSAGLVTVLGEASAAELAGVDHVVAGPDQLDRARDCPGERVALPLRPLGGRFPVPPPGFTDYAAEVSSYGDRFAPYQPVSADAPAVEIGGRVRTGAQLVAEARQDADRRGLAAGARLLTAEPLTGWDGLLAGLLLPLVSGGSVVLCRNLDPAALAARVNSERVTGVIEATPRGGLNV